MDKKTFNEKVVRFKPASTGQSNQNVPLGINARAVRIDNMSGTYILVEGAQAVCPPYTLGFTVMMLSGTNEGRLSSITPVSFTNVALTNEECVAIFTEKPLIPSPGIVMLGHP